jgi:hypothetical protein
VLIAAKILSGETVDVKGAQQFIESVIDDRLETE